MNTTSEVLEGRVSFETTAWTEDYNVCIWATDKNHECLPTISIHNL